MEGRGQGVKWGLITKDTELGGKKRQRMTKIGTGEKERERLRLRLRHGDEMKKSGS